MKPAEQDNFCLDSFSDHTLTFPVPERSNVFTISRPSDANGLANRKQTAKTNPLMLIPLISILFLFFRFNLIVVAHKAIIEA